MKDNSLIERMLFRLVKKHIAGTTMSAAISKVVELNKKNIPASVTFLSFNIDTKTKAKYISSTYMELIRRLSRLGLKASVHIKAEQLGLFLGEELMYNNFNEILSIGNKFGVFVWLELPEQHIELSKAFNGSKGYGVAFHEKEFKNFLSNSNIVHPTKIVFEEYNKNQAKNKANLNTEKLLIKYMKKSNNIILSSPPENLIKEIVSGKNKFKNNIVLEFKLGYNRKKINKYVKKNKKIIINVPFGKDWAEFAMNSVPEGYMRFLANNLLSEKKEK